MSISSRDILNLVHEMRQRGDAFAIATVVRTVSVTAAKPGAKAIINAKGQIVEGWIGGGCARGAVVKAAVQAIRDGQSRFVSISPDELLEDEGRMRTVDMSDYQGGASASQAPVHIQARNLCPSKGTMEVFVEPMLANPQLLIIGNSPVAHTLAELGPVFDLDVLHCDVRDFDTTVQSTHTQRYIVIATQGSGDQAALKAALTMQAQSIGFVGSGRKFRHLQQALLRDGMTEDQFKRIKCPAGLHIHAVTPQEIALSILAELIRQRREQPNTQQQTQTA